jgi:hypothetical protein
VKLSKGLQASRKSQIERLIALILVLVAVVFAASLLWQEFSEAMATDPVEYVRTLLPAPELPTLTLNIAFTEYDNLLAQRETALSDGVFLAGEQDFQTASIELRDTDGNIQEIPVRLRLRQGLAGNLGEGEKWPFDVRTRGGALLFGMRRFTLQDPAENNWLNQWAFSQALERDGILTSHTYFANLVLNGEPQGIYAVQEGFGEEVLTVQGRQPGVIVEFDADRLWEAIRYYEGNGELALADPFLRLTMADYLTFEVDAFRDSSLLRDPELAAQRSQAIGLLRSLQEGKIGAGDVFDVEKYGAFLALADLWAASEALSLVNLRFYYNPDSGTLEPIAYNANPLQTDVRISASNLFDSLEIQRSYLESAQRISQHEYIEELQVELDRDFRELQHALSVEQDVESPWEPLRERQRQMQRSLNPIQPIFAYLGPPSSSIIQVQVANVFGLPVEIVGFDIGGTSLLEVNPEWIQDGDPNLLVTDEAGQIILSPQDTAALNYVHFNIPLVDLKRLNVELDGLSDIELSVATRLVGLEDVQLTQAQGGYPPPLLPFGEDRSGDHAHE